MAKTVKVWCESSVAEGLLILGRWAARAADSGQGFPRRVAWLAELRQRPWRAADPGGFMPLEVSALADALEGLPEDQKLLLLMRYRSGFLRSYAHAQGRRLPRSRAGEEAASLRAIAAFAGCHPTTVENQLRRARTELARRLNGAAQQQTLASMREAEARGETAVVGC